MEFLRRTAMVLRRWFDIFHVPMFHQSVLQSVFSSAWKEVQQPIGNGMLPLAWARDLHSEFWWQTAKCFGKRARRKAGVVRAKPGRSATWEDVLVLAFGMEWRSQRGKVLSLPEWKRLVSEPINGICRQWGVPEVATRARPLPQELRSAGPLFDLPHREGLHLDDWAWEQSAHSFSSIVDNQALANLING